MRNYRKYSDADIIKYAKEVKSISGLLKCLDLRPCGGNYANIKRLLQKLDVDCSHWTGQGWNKGQRLKDWSKYCHVISAKPHLINLRGHKCEDCLFEYWKNQLIPLEIHHKDGNRTNNLLENLQLLCPNCHALTSNYRGRNNISNN